MSFVQFFAPAKQINDESQPAKGLRGQKMLKIAHNPCAVALHSTTGHSLRRRMRAGADIQDRHQGVAKSVNCVIAAGKALLNGRPADNAS